MHETDINYEIKKIQQPQILRSASLEMWTTKSCKQVAFFILLKYIK